MDKERFITIQGKTVRVTEDVYFAFKRPAWTERKRKQVRNDNERSLDAFLDDGYNIPSDQQLVDDIVTDKLLLDELYAALAELTEDERSLIDALYFQEKTERNVSVDMGLSQKAVNKRRHRVLEKLKNLMGF